jgi:hypothetical protein
MAILRQHLENQGARFVQKGDLNTLSTDDLRNGYLVVPYDTKVDKASLPERAGHLNIVTNFWVERCLHGKRLVDPTEDVFSRPFENLNIVGKLF